MAKENVQKKWESLKIEFLAGDYNTLAELARNNSIEIMDPSTGAFKRNTKGWLKEKEALRHEVGTKVLEIIKTNNIVNTLELNKRFQGVTSQALEAIEDYLQQGQFKNDKNVDICAIKKVFEAIDKGSKTNIFLDRYIRPPEIPEGDLEELPEGSQCTDDDLTVYQKWAKRLNR